ncbi:amidohydrolase family protein [Nonomuraea ferruginea]
MPLLAGTDATPFAPAHEAGLHRELELLTEAGLSAEEALAAATGLPARHFGLDDRGRIAPGLRADLVLVEGDPTRDITATGAIVDVWRRGCARPVGDALYLRPYCTWIAIRRPSCPTPARRSGARCSCTRRSGGGRA